MRSIFVIGIDHVVAKTTYLYAYAKSHNTKVTYFTSDTAGLSSTIKNEEVIYLKFSNFLNWLKLLFFLICKRPDHVELYFSRIYFETFPALIFCKFLKIPISLVSRGKDLRDHYEHRYIRRVLTKYICRQCDLILPKESSHVSVLDAFNLSTRTFVHEIHNGIPIQEFSKSKFGINSNTFLFLNAFRELRNLDILISAFAKLKENFPFVRLVMVGSSLETNFLPQEKEHEERILQLISDLKLQNSVDIYPFSSNPWQGIEDILGFVLPADQVWLNNALLEAMAYSIPPIIANAERAEFIIPSKEVGIICSKDDHSLYLAMKQLVESPERARTMGINAKSRVLEEFCSQQVGKKIYSLYQKYLWKAQ